jgi:hypothetical protein
MEEDQAPTQPERHDVAGGLFGAAIFVACVVYSLEQGVAR